MNKDWCPYPRAQKLNLYDVVYHTGYDEVLYVTSITEKGITLKWDIESSSYMKITLKNFEKADYLQLVKED